MALHTKERARASLREKRREKGIGRGSPRARQGRKSGRWDSLRSSLCVCWCRHASRRSSFIVQDEEREIGVKLLECRGGEGGDVLWSAGGGVENPPTETEIEGGVSARLQAGHVALATEAKRGAARTSGR